jgi:hypothetical protein
VIFITLVEFDVVPLELFGWIGGTHSLSFSQDVISWLSWCFGLERTHFFLVDGHG